MTELDADEQVDAAVGAWVEARLRRPIDLATSWPLRAELLRVGPDDHVLLVVFHHIACDAVSVGLFGEDVAATYDAMVAGRPAPLPPLPVQYADYAVANRAAVESPAGRRALDECTRALAGLTDLGLPTDRPRASVRDARGDGVDFTIEPALASVVRGLAVRCGVTPYMVLLAAFFVLLGRYVGRSDVAVGSPVANRDRPELAGLIGFFVNTVVLRGDLSGDPTFAGLVSRVRDEVVGSLSRQEVPFERVVQEVAPDRDLSRNPLFQVMFSHQSSPARLPRLAELEVALVPTVRRSAKFDVILELTDREDGGLAGVVEYATGLFDRARMDRLATHFVAICWAAWRSPRTGRSARWHW